MSEHGEEFREFFRDVWQVDPFAWQVRLVEEILREGRWPDVIDLPTGSGKTATLDVAVYTLSVRPDLLPRRIAFVVDRRLIVDQTATRAGVLAAALRKEGSGAAARVGGRLGALSSSGIPLDVGRLRGGEQRATETSEWLRWPDQPAIIVSTVDQFGSRLLFRGYGVSAGMRPVHSGLTGNDCLVVLDEVHLSTALAETLLDLPHLETVRRVPRRSQTVQMSATPAGATGTRFSLSAADLEPGSELAIRVQASKLARLQRVGKPRQAPELALADAIPGLVEQLGVDQGVIGVVVNRVATAREVGAALRSAWPNNNVLILTGRMRGLERVQVANAAIAAADPEGDREMEALTFVVATQCIEVGADLSFDGMVSEVAPLPSLQQRFGRLDRRGRASLEGVPAKAIVVGVESTLAEPADPVYGTALRETWEALSARFGSNEFDVGPASAELGGLPAECSVAAVRARVLMPAHLELLSYTNPEPHRSPDVAGFLHGDAEVDADVSLLWREDLDGASAAEVESTLLLLPPSQGELIAVPIGAVQRWMLGTSPGPTADVDAGEGAAATEGHPSVHLWRWRDGQAAVARASTIRPGDVLVAASKQGGLVDGVWVPASTAHVADVLSVAAREEGRLVVRGVFAAATDEEVGEDLLAVLEEQLSCSVFTDAEAAALRRMSPVQYRPGGWAWVAEQGRRGTSLDGADRTNSFVGKRVPLESHLDGVGALAAEMARRCGLSDNLVDDMRLAGELHDLGKLDPRFQVWLHGSEVAAALAPEPLAKGVGGFRPGWRGGYPDGARHEFLSVELAESAHALLRSANDADLVLHLVATHHGHGRPFAVVADDPEHIPVECSARGTLMRADTALTSGAIGVGSLRRFTTLTHRYGCHGLAWLETILRLADHRRSEMEAAS